MYIVFAWQPAKNKLSFEVVCVGFFHSFIIRAAHGKKTPGTPKKKVTKCCQMDPNGWNRDILSQDDSRCPPICRVGSSASRAGGGADWIAEAIRWKWPRFLPPGKAKNGNHLVAGFKVFWGKFLQFVKTFKEKNVQNVADDAMIESGRLWRPFVRSGFLALPLERHGPWFPADCPQAMVELIGWCPWKIWRCFFPGQKKRCFRTTLEPTEIAEIPLGLITTTLEMQVANVLVMHSLVSCHCQSLQKGLILFWRTLAHPELQRWAVTVGIALWFRCGYHYCRCHYFTICYVCLGSRVQSAQSGNAVCLLLSS